MWYDHVDGGSTAPCTPEKGSSSRREHPDRLRQGRGAVTFRVAGGGRNLAPARGSHGRQVQRVGNPNDQSWPTVCPGIAAG